ncbi:MAG: hypothetical protein OEX97_09620 [Acidimicrobiia bacterium]|nr:hypothetical protein [Acidimicrobiia bacterium]
MTHHRRGLRRLLNNDELADRIETDYRMSGIGTRQLAMLTYAEKLTLAPGGMTEQDLDTLRSAGFSDRDILDIVEVVAYYAYVNRIADGLGIQIEPWVQAAIDDAQAGGSRP